MEKFTVKYPSMLEKIIDDGDPISSHYNWEHWNRTYFYLRQVNDNKQSSYADTRRYSLF